MSKGRWKVKELSTGRFGLYSPKGTLTKVYSSKAIAQAKLKERRKLSHD